MKQYRTSSFSVTSSTRSMKAVAMILVITYAFIAMIPLSWIFLTGFKSPPDSIAYPPKVVFEPTLEGYVNLFTSRSRQTSEYIESLGPPKTWYERIGAKTQYGLSPGRSRFARPLYEFSGHWIWLHFSFGFSWHFGSLWLFPFSCAVKRRPVVLYSINTYDAASGGCDSHLPNVSRTGPL